MTPTEQQQETWMGELESICQQLLSAEDCSHVSFDFDDWWNNWVSGQSPEEAYWEVFG